MRRLSYDEIVCISAYVLILCLSVHSRMEGLSSGYESKTAVVCSFVCLVPMILKRCRILTLPGPFTVLIVLAVFLHTLGVLYSLYDHLAHYDTMTHFLSSVAVTACIFLTLMCYHVLNDRISFSGAYLGVFVALVMLGFSVYWEFFENIVDVFTGTSMQYSPFDTTRDMICNTVACFATVVLLQAYMNRHTPESTVERLGLHPKLVEFISRRKS